MASFSYLDPEIPCSERIKKIGCTQDAQCRSAVQNMYDCDDVKFCPPQNIPYAGGLAWTSAGAGAIECTCGQNAHCNLCSKGRKKSVGSCRMGARPAAEEAGVLDCAGMREYYIS